MAYKKRTKNQNKTQSKSSLRIKEISYRADKSNFMLFLVIKSKKKKKKLFSCLKKKGIFQRFSWCHLYGIVYC